MPSPLVVRDAVAKNEDGLRLMKAGDLEGAVQTFTAALDLIPDYQTAVRNRADAYQKLGNDDAADADLERAEQPAPGRQAFCPDCGHGNPADAWFCGNCRRRLRKPRKHWLAALLNVVPLGFGYLYVRRPKRFTATLLIGPLAVFAGMFFAIWYLFGQCFGGGCSGEESSNAVLILFSLPSLVTAVTAWNAWRIAREGQ